MTFQLPTTDEKADYVLKQFDRIARKYDLANDLISLGMHRLWKHRAIQEMSLVPSGRYLDVCTGTGDLAMLIAGSDKFCGEVVGLDFSSEMLAVAKQRQSSSVCSMQCMAEQRESSSGHSSGPSSVGAMPCVAQQLDNAKKNSDRSAPSVSWQQGDAQNLPFADNSFDAAIISFGLRNLTDLQKGLNEMSRVVKPGGKVLNLDLGQPDMPVFTPLFLFFFDKIVPVIGEIIQQDRKAYTYLPESRKNYPHPERLSEMFEKAGLTDVRWIKLALGSVALHVGTVR